MPLKKGSLAEDDQFQHRRAAAQRPSAETGHRHRGTCCGQVKAEEAEMTSDLTTSPPGLAVIFDGRYIQVTNMFDVDGDETDDPNVACSVAGKLFDGRWCSMKVLPGDIVKRNVLS